MSQNYLGLAYMRVDLKIRLIDAMSKLHAKGIPQELISVIYQRGTIIINRNNKAQTEGCNGHGEGQGVVA